MENINLDNKPDKDVSYWDKLFVFVNRITFSEAYWLRGGKIGLAVLASYFLLSFLCLFFPPILTGVGLGMIHYFSIMMLSPIEGLIGVRLTGSAGGWVPITEPNLLGLFFLGAVFFGYGSFFGSFLDLAKRKKIIPAIFVIIAGLITAGYVLIAYSGKTPFSCELLKDGFDDYRHPKSDCLLQYANNNIEAIDVSFCDSLGSSNTNKYDCYTIIAKRDGKLEYCDYISGNQSKKSSCYYSVNSINMDNKLLEMKKDLCRNKLDPIEKESCLKFLDDARMQKEKDEALLNRINKK